MSIFHDLQEDKEKALALREAENEIQELSKTGNVRFPVISKRIFRHTLQRSVSSQPANDTDSDATKQNGARCRDDLSCDREIIGSPVSAG